MRSLCTQMSCPPIAFGGKRFSVRVKNTYMPPIGGKRPRNLVHDIMLDDYLLNSLLDSLRGECVAFRRKRHLPPAIVRKDRKNSPGGDPSRANRETEITIFTGKGVVTTISILMGSNPRYYVTNEVLDTLGAEHWRPFLHSCLNHTCWRFKKSTPLDANWNTGTQQ